VNGRVASGFRENPTGQFVLNRSTANCAVTSSLASARRAMKTFNGEAWTDSIRIPLPPEGGHWTGKLYSKDRATGIRIGHGGRR